MAANRQIRETVFTAGSTFHIQRPRARLKKELGAVGAHLDTTTIRLVEVFSLSSPKGGEGGGEEATIIECPSPQPSPHSFVAGRGRKFRVVVSRCARATTPRKRKSSNFDSSLLNQPP